MSDGPGLDSLSFCPELSIKTYLNLTCVGLNKLMFIIFESLELSVEIVVEIFSFFVVSLSSLFFFCRQESNRIVVIVMYNILVIRNVSIGLQATFGALRSTGIRITAARLAVTFLFTTAKLQKPIRFTNVFKAIFCRPYFAKPLLPAGVPVVSVYLFSWPP